MENTYTRWKEATIHTIEEKTSSFDNSLQKKVEVDYLKRLLEKMATHAATAETLKTFQKDMDALVAAIPTKTGFEDKEVRRNFMKKKCTIKNSAVIKHKLVNKGYYVSMWMPIGMALGTPWGIFMGNIAFGLPIGLAVGLAIGSLLDRKATKEGRVV